MFKYLFLFLFSFTIASSNDNTVKTSELELFLFKIGFETLLQDVEVNKDKSTLNEQEIQNINQKIDLIMEQFHKNNRILLTEPEQKLSTQNIDREELEELKSEISFLKQEIFNLKNKKVVEQPQKTIVETKKKKIEVEVETTQKRVISSIANIYSRPNSEAEILRELQRDELVLIEACDKYGWCKIENTQGYIKKFLLK